MRTTRRSASSKAIGSTRRPGVRRPRRRPTRKPAPTTPSARRAPPPAPAAGDPPAADAFWGGRRVAAFTDDLIRAAVHTGEFSDPAAEKYLGDGPTNRRDKIKSVYLTAVNPVVDPRLDANGRLTFDNAAISAGVASG